MIESVSKRIVDCQINVGVGAGSGVVVGIGNDCPNGDGGNDDVMTLLGLLKITLPRLK